MKKHKDILANAILLIFLILADQSAKYIIRSSGGFYICNKNLSFGIQLDSLAFYLLWAFIIIIIIYLFGRKISSWSLWSISYILILSGAFGNMLDRLFYGCVIDFVDLGFWPIFNLADVFITAGVILILLSFKQKI